MFYEIWISGLCSYRLIMERNPVRIYNIPVWHLKIMFVFLGLHRCRDGPHGFSGDILSLGDSLPPYQSREPSIIYEDSQSDLESLLDGVNIDLLLGEPVNWDFPSRLDTTAPLTWTFQRQCPKGTVHWNFPKQTDLDRKTQWDFRKVLGEDGPVRWAFHKQLQDETEVTWMFRKCLSQESEVNWIFPNQLDTLRNLNWCLPRQSQDSTVYWYFRKQLSDISSINWNFPRQLPDHCSINWNFQRQLTDKNMVNWGFKGNLSHVYRLPLLWGFPKALTCRPFIRWAFTPEIPKISPVKWDFQHALEPPGSESGIRWTFQKNLELNGSTIRWAFKKNLGVGSALDWAFPSMVERIEPVHWHFDRQINVDPLGIPDRELVSRETQSFKDKYARSYQLASEKKRSKTLMTKEGLLSTIQPRLNFRFGIPVSFGSNDLSPADDIAEGQ